MFRLGLSRRLALTVALGLACALPGSGAAGREQAFSAAIDRILAEPYQPAYVPTGTDSAFDPPVANTAPAEDYTSGSIPGSPDAPAWPASFQQVIIHSFDGAPFYGELALHAGKHPAVLVVHGFNTHGYASVIRWAALLYADGYDVLAADQRDFSFEYGDPNQYGYPNWQQTLGWKEAEDVLAAGSYLQSQPGVADVGVVGFSEGAQNTVLALALDAARHTHVFDAGLTFSGPADQDTQIYSTAFPGGCSSPACTYPTTDALVSLVVPPYDNADVCVALQRAAAYYGTDGFTILSRETAFHAQTMVQVPLLNFYSSDDSLVPPFEASMMAGYEAGNPLQRTILIAKGEHAYFYDRWWQQRAILLYFHAMLGSALRDPTISDTPTVDQTPGDTPLSTQLVPLGDVSRAAADARLAPYICDTSRGAPGAAN